MRSQPSTHCHLTGIIFIAEGFTGYKPLQDALYDVFLILLIYGHMYCGISLCRPPHSVQRRRLIETRFVLRPFVRTIRRTLSYGFNFPPHVGQVDVLLLIIPMLLSRFNFV